MKQYILVAVLMLFTLGIGFGVQKISAQINSNECHTIRAASDVPQGYASPVNLFGSSLLMKTLCTEFEGVVAQVGDGSKNQYIYKYGYQRIDGDWERIEYVGATRNGPWIIGSATAQLQSQKVLESGTYLAYICQKIEGRWKCGCEDNVCEKAKWNVQTYTNTDKESKSNDDTLLQSDLEELKGSTGSEDDVLDVYYPSAYIGLPGDTVELYGSGFKKTAVNDILWNGEKKQTLTSPDGGTLEVTIPDDEPGKYEVEVEVNGTHSKYNTVIWIGTGADQPPSITHVTPEIGDQGGTYTIHGTGFTPENNDIITTFGILTELSSEDGNTITFVYDPFDEELISYNTSGERSYQKAPIHVTVVNTSGVSNSEMFKLKF